MQPASLVGNDDRTNNLEAAIDWYFNENEKTISEQLGGREFSKF
jgi:hypothetical protein